LITPDFKEDLYKYMTGIVRNQGQKLIAINGMPDHVHILIGLKPAMALADLVREMARGLRRIFLRAFPTGSSRPLHSKPGKASPEAVVQRRIHDLVAQVRYCV